jgi:hypothetical protein
VLLLCRLGLLIDILFLKKFRFHSTVVPFPT